MEDIVFLLLFILPAYFANAIPVVLGGGLPVDFGRKAWDGRRIFGDGKTWRGFFAGVVAGTVVGLLEANFLHVGVGFLGFLLALGTMLGDLFGSFLKRRLGMERGSPMFAIDQLPFLFFALAFASVYYLPSLEGVALLVILTYFLHVSTNFLANRLGLKKVPW